MKIALGVVLLAAGASRRMGRPKLLLPWAGSSILGHLLRRWQELGPRPIAVVCAANDSALAGELDRLGFPRDQRVVNPEPDAGMFSSIQCAARWSGWLPDLTHWAIALGDQPHLRAETLRQLIGFAARHPGKVCQPTHNRHRGHPVILPEPIFRQLPDAPGPTLREFLAHNPTGLALCPVADPGLHLDLDTPADYDRARRRAWASG